MTVQEDSYLRETIYRAVEQVSIYPSGKKN